MALCTNCGAVMHPDDMERHVCDAADVPVKGKLKRITTTEKAI